LFIQTEENKYYFKEKEALNYIIKVTEKVLTKRLEKNIKDSKTTSTAKTSKNSKSTSSVNNNFNSTLSISSFGTNNYFSKNQKIIKENSLPQNNLINSNVTENNKNKSKKAVKVKLDIKNNSTSDSFKDTNNISSLKLNKKYLNNSGINNIKSNVHKESFNTNSEEFTNFKKYDYTTNNLNTLNNDANILASNLIHNKNSIQNNNNNANNYINKNIKKR